MVLLQETKLFMEGNNKYFKSWKNWYSLVSPSIGASWGLAILWKPNSCQIHPIISTGNKMVVKVSYFTLSFIFIDVYDPT